MIRLKSLITEGNGPLKDQWLSKGLNIAKQLVSRGFSKEQASAIVGNMWAESTFNPAAKNSIGAIGLLQWLGDRKKALIKFANQKKKPWSNFDLQLDFIKYELLDAYNGTYSYEVNQFSKAMNHGKTIQDRAEGFAKFSERPGASELSDSLPTRRTAAHNVFSALTKKIETPVVKSTIVGSTVYPLQANGFVNVRDEDYVNNGVINNIIKRVDYPNAVGVITYEKKGQDGKTWYYVKLNSGGVGWVRRDAVSVQENKYYTVQAGDTLTKIAGSNKTTVEKLKQKNQLTSDTIQIGQKLKI